MLFANGSVEETSHPLIACLRLVVPWTFPLLGVLAVVDAVRIWAVFVVKKLHYRWVERLSNGASTDLVLIIGMTRKGLELTRAETRRSSVVVIEQDSENPLFPQAHSHGAVVWVGDGRSESDLKTTAWKRPARIWIMTKDTRKNLFILELVRFVFADPLRRGARGKLPEVNVYIQTAEFQERRDAVAIDSLNKDGRGIMTHLFNQEEAFAEWLIKSHPVRPNKDGRLPRVLLIGLGQLGRAIMRELIALCHFPGNGMAEILMVDAEPQDKLLFREVACLKGSLDRTSDLLSVKTDFKQEDAQAWLYEHYRDNIRGGEPFSLVFICIGSEFGNLALANRIAAWERLLNPVEDGRTKIVPVGYERVAESLADAQDDASVQPFYVESVYSPDAFEWREQCLVNMAIRINLAHGRISDPIERLRQLREACIGTPRCDWGKTLADLALGTSSCQDLPVIHARGDKPDEWTNLSEHKRRSSIAQARYLFNRFCTEAKCESGAGPHWKSTFADGAGDDIVKCLEEEAGCEHRRWRAFMLLENHSPATPGPYDPDIWREADKPDKPLAHGRKVRDLACINRCLIDYEDLDEETKARNTLIVATFDWIKRAATDAVSAAH